MTHFGQVKISPNIFDPLLQLSGLNIVTIFAIVECSRTSHKITRLVALAMDYFLLQEDHRRSWIISFSKLSIKIKFNQSYLFKNKCPNQIPIYPADHLSNKRSNTSISSITHSLLAICGHLIAITKNSPTADVWFRITKSLLIIRSIDQYAKGIVGFLWKCKQTIFSDHSTLNSKNPQNRQWLTWYSAEIRIHWPTNLVLSV